MSNQFNATHRDLRVCSAHCARLLNQSLSRSEWRNANQLIKRLDSAKFGSLWKIVCTKMKRANSDQLLAPAKERRLLQSDDYLQEHPKQEYFRKRLFKLHKHRYKHNL